MALINCVECKKMISDKAVICPRCGFPMASQKNETTSGTDNVDNVSLTSDTTPELSVDRKKRDKRTALILIVIFIPIIVGIAFASHSCNNPTVSSYSKTYDHPLLEELEPILESIGIDTFYVYNFRKTSNWAEGDRYCFDYGNKLFMVYYKNGKLVSVNCNGKILYKNGRVLIHVR